MILYWYPGCSTCRKARKWLDARGVEVEVRHLVEATPTAETLADLWRRADLPLRRMFNASGGAYRAGDFKSRLPTMTDDEAVAELAANGMLIKRPLLDTGDRVLVGFREVEWTAALG